MGKRMSTLERHIWDAYKKHFDRVQVPIMHIPKIRKECEEEWLLLGDEDSDAPYASIDKLMEKIAARYKAGA